MTLGLSKPKAHLFSLSLSPKALAILALLLAQLAIALGVFCIKISVTEIGSLGTIFNRCWIAGVVFLLWHQTHRIASKPLKSDADDSPSSPSCVFSTYIARYTHKQINIQRVGRLVILFVAAGIIWVACLVLWGCSLNYTNVANSTLMHDLSPLFATLLGWLFFRHRFSWQFLSALGITLMGVVTIGLEDMQVGFDHLLGDGLALLSAVFLAAYCLLVGHLRSHFSSTAILQWVCLLGSLSLIPVIVLASGSFWPVSPLGWLAITGVVCLSQIIGQGLTAYSLKEVSSELTSLFFPLEAVFVAIVAWIGFGEHLTGLNYLGFGLVLAGIYVALLNPPTDPSHESA